MEIKQLTGNEIQDAYRFCKEVFLQTENFFSSPEEAKPFLESVDHFTAQMDFVGAYEKELGGVIGYDRDTYALLLFLMKEEQGKEELFQYFLEIVKKTNIARIGALVTPSAQPFYESLGFEQVEQQQEQNGIAYVVMEYLLQKEYLGKQVTVTIDHPYGSLHPHLGNIYFTCNYGYVDELLSKEGAFQDAYVVGIEEPMETFKGIVIGILYRKNEQESKWLVAKDNKYKKDEVIKEIAFQEQFYDSRIEWYEG